MENDIDITSNYTANLIDMEEIEAQQKMGERILVVEKDWKRCQADNKAMRGQIVGQTNDILKLRQDL